MMAEDKYKLSGILGELHSHPSKTPFRPPDLFHFLNEFDGFHEPPILMSDLVNKDENIFVFRTRETFTVTPLDMWPQSFPRLFEDHWIEQAGYKFSQDRTHLVQVGPTAAPWKANVGIAEMHRFALYRGKLKGYLIRAYL